METYIKKKDWLIPVVFILFMLAVILIPFAAECTYAGREESPDHILTYKTGKLTWDSATDIDKQTGAAKLSLFHSTYHNVQAENGDKVIAPGTEGKNIVRLKNDTDHSITYVAVMYRMKEENSLPVEPVMEDKAAYTVASDYSLPDGVSKEQVVKAVTGTVGANTIQDFDITWLWEYYEDEQRDWQDTKLGNTSAWDIADEVEAGLYIVVRDDYDSADSYISAQVPKTGDDSDIALYAILLAVSGILLFLFFLEQRKEK